MDLYHPDEPRNKVAGCCTVSDCAREAFYSKSIAPRMLNVNVGHIFYKDCPLFVKVEDDMPPQFTLLNVKRGMTVWPGSYLHPYKISLQ